MEPPPSINFWSPKIIQKYKKPEKFSRLWREFYWRPPQSKILPTPPVRLRPLPKILFRYGLLHVTAPATHQLTKSLKGTNLQFLKSLWRCFRQKKTHKIWGGGFFPCLKITPVIQNKFPRNFPLFICT